MGFSPPISNFLLNRALLLQEYTVKNPIFVFLTSLTNFPTIFWALLPPVIFLTSFGYIFLYIFCGDPKMGYNRCPLFIMLTEQGFCAVSFIKINPKRNSRNWSGWSLIDLKLVFYSNPPQPQKNYAQNLVILRSLLAISLNQNL